MVVVAQLVRASVCGTEGRGFEPHLPPIFKVLIFIGTFLFSQNDSSTIGEKPVLSEVEVSPIFHPKIKAFQSFLKGFFCIKNFADF